MRISNATWIAAALVAASTAVALWAWLTLPPSAGVPINYLGLDGVRHHGVTRLGVWLIPAISTVVVLSMTLSPLLGAQREVERATQVFDSVVIAISGLMLVVEIALIGRALDPDFNVMRPVAIAVGVLLVVVGNYLGKARQNGFIGIKTPWTLSDAGVWDKTHRFTGRAMVLGGLALIVLGLLFHEAVVLGLAIAACTAIPMLVGAVHSRSLYRALPRG
jgi:uncharacterized membrane protein